MAALTRRAALGAIASIPAMGGAVTSLAASMPTTVERPDELAFRLATELSEAMNGFMTAPGYQPLWVAHVKPSFYQGPISFSSDADGPVWAALTQQQKAYNLRRAAAALKQAMTDLHGVPCKMNIGSDADTLICMTEKAVR